MKKERFDKIISNQFNISRKDARIAIRRGKGFVDGCVLKDPSAAVDIESEIVFDGKKLDYKKYVYILMNKPKGVLSASEDKRQKAVVDLVPLEFKRNGLFPVGRLDKDTTGLLIITNDGDFAHRVISPNKDVDKVYIATLDGTVTKDMEEAFLKGVVLADGTVCKSAKLEGMPNNKAKVTVSEGKYHQIKRMFGTVGLGVNELERRSIGDLCLPTDMQKGECKLLNDEEISLIFSKC
ncbi:MAG: pseudouridine synthase [Ruminococcaceae bacterium]|nr:pseudouridine synthase [Oscillospiraceae bacterium]